MAPKSLGTILIILTTIAAVCVISIVCLVQHQVQIVKAMWLGMFLGVACAYGNAWIRPLPKMMQKAIQFLGLFAATLLESKVLFGP